MKILHFCTQEPGFNSGGALGVYQFSYALTHIGCNVDYVGPAIINENILSWYGKKYFLEKKLNIIQKIWTILHLQFDKKYLSWKELNIDFSSYDVIFIEFTKFDYVTRDIINSGYKGKIITRAHNVEYDFFRINYLQDKTPIKLIKFLSSKYKERFMVQKSDIVLAITAEDKNRLMELYSLQEDKVKVCPIGVNLPQNEPAFSGKVSNKLKCLITGSLWFGPNSKAALWFIKEVFPSIKQYCELTIAGNKPNDEVKTACKENDVNLVDSPDSMVGYFNSSEIFVAPIFEGGGMKVKIAEAMSYGLPVVTTKHGAIGYEISNGENCYIADTKDEFVAAITDYYEKSEEDRKKFLESAWYIYNNNYSLTAIKNKVKEIIWS